MRAVRTERSPEAGLPGRYFATGLVAFILFSLAVPLFAPVLIVTNADPRIFALTHLAVLGWITMTMIGASYQLFPAALGGTLRGAKLGRWNYWLLAAGIAGFLPSFYLIWAPGVAVFGSLIVGGLIHFVSQMLRSYPSVANWHPMAFYMFAAHVWLVITLGFGAAYALNWQFGWFAISNRMLAAHAHVGLAGWLGLTLMGVSYRLTELFSDAKYRGRVLAFVNLVMWNAGLLGLVVSLLITHGGTFVVVFAAVLALAALLHVVDLLLVLHSRRAARLSIEQWHTLASLGSLLVAAGLGLGIASGRLAGASWVVAYGYTVVAGWFGFAIIGKSYLILPFLTRLHYVRSGSPQRPAPLLHQMFDKRVARVSLALLLSGFTGVLVGVIATNSVIARAAGALYAAGAVVFAGNLGRRAFPLALSRRHRSTSKQVAR
jgi:hypothetical protein